MDLSGETGRRDLRGGPVDNGLVAVVAAVWAAFGEEYRPAHPPFGRVPAGAHPKGMPVWKRAALAELVNAGTDIRDFI